MCKFSVIVPVYKVEAVLPRCIESILNQTVTDFELILVDDGSPDRSGAICDEYAAADSRIRVIHQENGGVSRARNAGLDIAQGQYIVFVDSDDWVDTDFLACFATASADMIIAGYQIEGHGISSPIIRQYGNRFFSNLTPDDIVTNFELGHLNYACTKAFSASIIQQAHIRFDESLHLSEDTLFTVQVVIRCRSVQQIDACGYHYVKYSHETLTGGKLLSISSIQKIETANNKIYLSLKEYLGFHAESAVARRIFPLYRNILSECIYSTDCTWDFISYLFRQTWFQKSLDHVENFCADEDSKYRALLKTKSPVLFWLYVQLVRRKKTHHRSNIHE